MLGRMPSGAVITVTVTVLTVCVCAVSANLRLTVEREHVETHAEAFLDGLPARLGHRLQGAATLPRTTHWVVSSQIQDVGDPWRR